MKTMMPAVRSAIMWGRKQMGVAAKNRARYMMNSHRAELRKLTRKYKTMTKEYRRFLGILNSHVRGVEKKEKRTLAQRLQGGRGGTDLQSLLGLFGQTMKGDVNSDVSAVQTLINGVQEGMRDTENQLRAILAATDIYDDLKRYLDAQAPKIASEAAWRYKLQWAGTPYGTAPPQGVNSVTEYLKNEMMAEAAMLTDFWTRNTRSTLRRIGGSIALGTRAIGMQAMRAGDVYRMIVSNLWEFLTGPWILGSAIVIAQFFFLSWWSPTPVNPLIMFAAPAVGLLFLTLVNMFTAKYPMEIFTHMISGIIISYTAIIFLAAMGWEPPGTIMSGTYLWWFGFILLGIIGAFQFYATGGFNAIVPIAVIIMVFGYFSLGPYSGYVREVRDQILTPLKFVWLNVKNTFSGIWLLMVNPTEWYAQQQLMNVRPETPTDFPKGIEITRLDAVPDSVPSGSKFYMYAILENKGEQDAHNIVISASCQGVEAVYNAETGAKSTFLGINTEATSGITGGRHCNVVTTKIDHKSTLRKGEGDSVRVDFTAQGRPESTRAAEVVFAKPVIHVNYTYSTTSSLTTEIATWEEIQRRQTVKTERYYYNEIAKGKAGPAQFSLNVGPQPLESGRDVILTASISNTRFDGIVALDKGTKMMITVPSVLGSNLKCESIKKGDDGSIIAQADDCPNGMCTITMLQKWDIRAYEFGEIFPIYCKFTVNTLGSNQQSLTGLITAKLDNYKFMLLMEKSVKVTAPLGGWPISGTTECAAGPKENWDKYTASDMQTMITNAVNKNDMTVSGTTLKSLTQLVGNENDAKLLVASRIWPPATGSGGSVTAVGEIPQKIQAAANKYNVPFELALKVAAQESSMAHCKDGTNSCGPDGVKGSSAGCVGIMQICSWSSCSMTREDVLDIDKNIDCGVKILRSKYDQFKNGCSGVVAASACEGCNYQSYTEWNAALRGYNGWACNCANCDEQYVDRVNSKDVSKYMTTSTTPQTTPSNLIGKIWKLDLADIDSAQCESDVGSIQQIKDSEQVNINCGVKILAKKKQIDGIAFPSDASLAAWKNCYGLKQIGTITTGSVVLGNCEYAGRKDNGDWSKAIAERTASPKDTSFDPTNLVPWDKDSSKKMSPNTLACAKILDEKSGGKLKITSAYRAPSDPSKITSRHQTGQAIDFVIDGETDFSKMALLAEQTGCFTWVYNEESGCPGSTGPHIHASIGVGSVPLLGGEDTDVLQSDPQQ